MCASTGGVYNHQLPASLLYLLRQFPTVTVAVYLQHINFSRLHFKTNFLQRVKFATRGGNTLVLVYISAAAADVKCPPLPLRLVFLCLLHVGLRSMRRKDISDACLRSVFVEMTSNLDLNLREFEYLSL